jgi:hypothetical protein
MRSIGHRVNTASREIDTLSGYSEINISLQREVAAHRVPCSQQSTEDAVRIY